MANNQTPNVPDRPPPPEGQILIYRDGALDLQVRLDGQTAWLPQRLIAELYQITVPTVSEHLTDIYEEGELGPQATIRKFRIVQREGTRDVSRMVDHYNLDAILAVGYRVRSQRGTQFRQWATARLSELLVKGFTLDDERIKAGRTIGQDYFDELLEHIRRGKGWCPVARSPWPATADRSLPAGVGPGASDPISDWRCRALECGGPPRPGTRQG